jgi:hypothetical protein
VVFSVPGRAHRVAEDIYERSSSAFFDERL